MLICLICLLRAAVRRDACAAATRSIVPSVALRQLHDGSPEELLLYAFKFDTHAVFELRRVTYCSPENRNHQINP